MLNGSLQLLSVLGVQQKRSSSCRIFQIGCEATGVFVENIVPFDGKFDFVFHF